MVAVIDLDARAAVHARERIRDRAQLRGELLVGEPCHPEPAVGERHVGDHAGARVLPGRRVGDRCVRHLDALELERFEVHELDLARAVDAEERGRRAGALAPHGGDIGVAGCRVDREVGDDHVGRARAEQSRQLDVERLDAFRAGDATLGAGAEVERDDGRTLIVSGEERPVGTERDAARSTASWRPGPGPWSGLHDRAGRRGRPRRRGDNDERDQ